MIVGMVGLIGSGKDTSADYLVNFHGYRRESFAGILKDAVSVVFGWDRTMLEGRTKQSREWREQVDTWWATKLNIPGLTPRWVLQQWGTEVLRKGFHDDIWIAGLENKLRNSNDNIVISDCRFPNEINAIRNQGGKIVWVQRGPLPDWYDYAVVANTSTNTYSQNLAKDYLTTHNIHASETSWIGTKFDCIVDNNSKLDELFSQLKNLVQCSQVSMAT
jgi:hypothetical protein